MPLKPSQVLLYAAVPPDYQIALGAAGMAGIPPAQVISDFQKAWETVAGGGHLVIAVGRAALNALYYNPCGWANPMSQPGGHTPFNVVSTPRASLPGANVFVNGAGLSALDTLQISAAFAYYAVAGNLPSEFTHHPNPIAPTEVCLGTSTVPCPCAGRTARPVSGASAPVRAPSPVHSVPYWGVDSAAAVTASFFQCVSQHYGTPSFWGRYLKTVPGVSDGLTKSEIAFLHQHGVKILPIYNNFGSATGNSNGQANANNAIAVAKSLDMPSGVVIFADVEENYAVDAGWIEGWVDVFRQSPYLPGIYNNPIHGEFPAAYEQAVRNDATVAKSVILWSNEREPGITTRAFAPAWNPASPNASGRVLAWQYGENGTACSAGIDTDLVDPSLISHLW